MPRKHGAGVPVVARLTPDFLAQVTHYAQEHDCTISDLIREGLEWCIAHDPPAPPEAPLSPALVEAIRALVREAIQTEEPPLAATLVVPEPPSPPPPRAPKARPPAPGAPGFDATRFYLGTLCPQRHEHGTTGQTLKRKSTNQCPQCQAAQRKARWAKARQT